MLSREDAMTLIKMNQNAERLFEILRRGVYRFYDAMIEAGFSENQMVRHMYELEKAGLVVVVKGYNRKEYMIVPKNLDYYSSEQVAKLIEDLARRIDQQTLRYLQYPSESNKEYLRRAAQALKMVSDYFKRGGAYGR